MPYSSAKLHFSRRLRMCLPSLGMLEISFVYSGDVFFFFFSWKRIGRAAAQGFFPS